MHGFLRFIDWFIPDNLKGERSDLSVARLFVFTHLFGPALSQSISVFLYRTDQNPGFATWTIIVCISAFWLLPFLLKYSHSLQVSAFASVELLAFTALFGAYHYGGVSSPFLPWLIVSLMLGFFYLSEKPLLVVGMFALNISIFLTAYALNDFPQHVSLADLSTVGWISILSATVYMSWMAIYYANITSMRSELERETERHRATAVRLREAKEFAERANRSRSIFLAKMSHELRTPLNAVIGYSEMLLENCEGEPKNADKVIDLQRINAAGKHLLSLVADVLDLSKIESDSVEMKIEDFDFESFIKDVITTTNPIVEKNGNRLGLQFSSPVGTISTDQTKLRQVIMNLISNAAKFTKDGAINVLVRRDRRSSVDWLEVQVRDTGIGIAQDELARLFQNFAQASAATSGKYGGSGLGLVISQKLSALMGGTVTVTSEVGKGSCFIVRIPAVLTSFDEITETVTAAPASGTIAAAPAT